MTTLGTERERKILFISEGRVVRKCVCGGGELSQKEAEQKQMRFSGKKAQ